MGENALIVGDANEEALRRELDGLFAAARTGELAPADFAARLESIHTRFRGEEAQTPELIERRRSASAAYEDLVSAEDLDTHHRLELLAGTLGVATPPSF
jgi:hypothetical protein